MAQVHSTAQRAAFAAAVLEQMPVAVTVIGIDGTVLYFNDHAARALDRRPEHIGKDVRSFHKPESRARIDAIVEAFRSGRREQFYFEDRSGETKLAVTVAPLIENGSLTGCIQCVRILIDPATA